MPRENLLRNSQFPSYKSDFIFEQFPQRLNKPNFIFSGNPPTFVAFMTDDGPRTETDSITLDRVCLYQEGDVA